jgi:hypothetical protein
MKLHVQPICLEVEKNVEEIGGGGNEIRSADGVHDASVEVGMNNANVQSGVNIASVEDGVDNTNVESGVNITSAEHGVINTTSVEGGLKTICAEDGVINASIVGGVDNASVEDGIINASVEGEKNNTAVEGGMINDSVNDGVNDTSIEGRAYDVIVEVRVNNANVEDGGSQIGSEIQHERVRIAKGEKGMGMGGLNPVVNEASFVRVNSEHGGYVPFAPSRTRYKISKHSVKEKEQEVISFSSDDEDSMVGSAQNCHERRSSAPVVVKTECMQDFSQSSKSQMLREIEVEKYIIAKKRLEIEARWLKLEEDKLAFEEARALYEVQELEKHKASSLGQSQSSQPEDL